MQLILEAENSEINIKEKMTTVEDSIDKLTNGVIEIERTPEKVVSNSDKVNSLNGENVIESKKNIETVDKAVLEDVPEPPSEDFSKNISKSNGKSHKILGDSETTSDSNGEFLVDIIKETETSIEKKENRKKEESPKVRDDKKNIEEKHNDNVKSEDRFKLQESENSSKQQDDDDNKPKTKDPEGISEHRSKENVNIADNIKKVGKSVELCESQEDQNDFVKKVKEIDDKNVHTIDNTNKEENQNSEVIINKTDECRNEQSSLEKEGTEKVRNTILEREQLSDNNTLPINKISDLKQTEMECDKTVPIGTVPNESTPTPMDYDKDNDLDLIDKDKSENQMEQDQAMNQIGIKEDIQIGKTDTQKNEAIIEKSKNVEEENVVNNAREIQEKDKPTSTESTPSEKMEICQEAGNADCLKTNKENEKAMEIRKTTDGLDDNKKAVVSDSLTVRDSPCQGVNLDTEEVNVKVNEKEPKVTEIPVKPKILEKPTPTVCKLSNTLNILSDDEDEPPKKEEIQDSSTKANYKQCINIEDDDDVMVIEDTATQDEPESISSECTFDKKDLKSDIDSVDANVSEVIKQPEPKCNDEKEDAERRTEKDDSSQPKITDTIAQEPLEERKKEQPLLPKDLFKSYKKNLTEMTRDELEEFCILKIVESIIDRSSLNEIKTKHKTMAQTVEEYKKKAMMLTKQNRDLQVVLKSIQEEQKKGGASPIVPLKITRSVGMQVLMTDKNARRKVNPTPTPGQNLNTNKPVRNVNQSARQQAPVTVTNQQIPVPRLVPASNNVAASKAPNPAQVAATRNTAKPNNSLPNGVRSSPPAPKVAEKRNRVQSVTVDLTDDEPPPKVQATKTSPAPPVRLVPPQNLLTPRAQMASNTLTTPRKVYIPIGGTNQNQNVRPGQTLMLKNLPNTSGPRPRGVPPMGTRGQAPNQVRMARLPSGRHPAPLPDAVKQYQPPNWKALPPAPDLKLSKVENGIVISWKIDGYQEDSYEEIASYQLYAYQETSSPPNTSLWKKIGDVKALPLPMACTLTQFMAGYKYYFAVRAVDIRSRLGPFSLPGSILLLNKM